MREYRLMAILLVGVISAPTVLAQEQTPSGGTPEPTPSLSARGDNALTEDEADELEQITGATSSVQTWDEFVTDWMTPKPFPKKQVLKIDEEYAYPHLAASIKMKIVREDDENVWLVGIPPEDPNSPLYKIWARREANQALYREMMEYQETPGAVNFVDFSAEFVPPPFMESLQFEPVEGDLPQEGRWQMNFAVADFNEDGKVDLAFPPRRKGYPVAPVIYLGDGEGGFTMWRDARWPESAPWDYGGLVAADFDLDGHMDLAFAIHFKSQFVLYGDGTGNFGRGDHLRSPDPRITSRAVTSADIDGDGRPDLAFIAEIDYDITSSVRIEDAPTAWVLFNRESGWQLSHDGLPSNVIGDVIRAADFDGDGSLELVLSSSTLGMRFLVYSLAENGTWKAEEQRGFLSAAYHYDVEPTARGLFSTFVQFRRWQGATQARNGLVYYPVAATDEEFVVGRPLVMDWERNDVFFRLAVGDIDGDGRVDLATGRRGGGLEVYLQTADGSFVREEAPELADVGRAFDLRLVDIDGDGRDDLVAACAPQGDLPGGVFVWLTRPAP